MGSYSYNLLGGDEVGAVVLDFGHYSIKAGYAGEDSPKSEIPSVVGVSDAMERAESGDKIKNYHFDVTGVNVPRTGQEINTILRDGMIEQWTLFEKMLNYIYERHIQSDSALHPVMFSEATWNTKKHREKIAEILFEKFKVPACYLAKSGMLAAFSAAKSTALVLDSGDHHTTAIPVYEGHVLHEAVVKTPYGGDYLTGLCYRQLLQRDIEINPYYLVKSKEPVASGQPSVWQRRTNLPNGITNSWKLYMIREELRNYKTTALRTYYKEYNEKAASDAHKDYNPVEYHFPDGYNFEPTWDEQFQLTEMLFNPKFEAPNRLASGPNTSVSTAAILPPPAFQPPSITYPQLVLASIAKCDIDIRPLLLNSVVLAGGNTLIEGFPDRLHQSLLDLSPQNLKVKVNTSSTQVERRYASWIGGSILSSLGHFQQLWISKLEYEESGINCVHNDPR